MQKILTELQNNKSLLSDSSSYTTAIASRCTSATQLNGLRMLLYFLLGLLCNLNMRMLYPPGHCLSEEWPQIDFSWYVTLKWRSRVMDAWWPTHRKFLVMLKWPCRILHAWIAFGISAQPHGGCSQKIYSWCTFCGRVYRQYSLSMLPKSTEITSYFSIHLQSAWFKCNHSSHHFTSIISCNDSLSTFNTKYLLAFTLMNL